MKTRSMTIGTGAVALAVAMLGTPAFADTINIAADSSNSLVGIGEFEGSVDYTFDGLVGQLVVSLTNTTDAGYGGFLTALAFDINGDVNLSNFQSDNGMSNQLTEALAPPFNTAGGDQYDVGAAVGTAWLNTGVTNQGLALGETGTFTWDVTGTDAALLTAMDFVDAGQKAFGFVVRFRGLQGQFGHDKVPATAAAVVPLPAPVALGAVGLVGAFFGSRRMRRNTKS